MKAPKRDDARAFSRNLGISPSIALSLDKNKNQWTIEIYIKDFEPMANPIPGIYIASKEFPKELLFWYWN